MILGEDPTDELDGITLTAEKHKQKLIYLLYGVKIYKLKTKHSKLNAYSFCLGNTLKYFLVANMKKTGLYGYVYAFSHDIVIVDNILEIHKYLMKKHNIK